MKLYTQEEVCKILHIGISTLHNMRVEKVIRAIPLNNTKIRKHYRYDVEQYLRKHGVRLSTNERDLERDKE